MYHPISPVLPGAVPTLNAAIVDPQNSQNKIEWDLGIFLSVEIPLALLHGFNTLYPVYAKDKEKYKLVSVSNIAILQVLLRNRDKSVVEGKIGSPQFGDIKFTLEEANGSTQFCTERAGCCSLHNVSFSQIMFKLLDDVIRKPHFYSPHVFTNCCRYILTNHNHVPLFLIKGVSIAITNIPIKIGKVNTLKLAAVNWARRFPDTYTTQELLNISEALIWDHEQGNTRSIGAVVDNIILHRKEYPHDLFWAALICCVLKCDLDSSSFNYAAKHVTTYKHDYPQQVITRVAARVIIKQKSFFYASILDNNFENIRSKTPPERERRFVDFYRSSGNINALREYSEGLHQALNSDEKGHIVTCLDGDVFLEESNFFTAKDLSVLDAIPSKDNNFNFDLGGSEANVEYEGSLRAMWEDTCFIPALRANADRLDLACFLIKYKDHPAVKLYNAGYRQFCEQAAAAREEVTKILRDFDGALSNDFTDIYKQYTNQEHSKIQVWNQIILRTLIEQSGKCSIEVTLDAVSITLVEIKGGCTLCGTTPLFSCAVNWKLECMSLSQIKNKLMEVVLGQPNGYQNFVILQVLEDLLITKKDYYSTLTGRAAVFVADNADNMTSKLKFAAVNCARRFKEKFDIDELFGIVEVLILEKAIDSEATIPSTLESILAQAGGDKDDLLWGACIYSILKMDPDSTAFKCAAKYIGAHEQDFPEDVVAATKVETAINT